MDITMKFDQQVFNFRVCALMISDGKILAMRDDGCSYDYLPGGRVQLQETSEHAVIREAQEEIGETVEMIRPVWFNQAFLQK